MLPHFVAPMTTPANAHRYVINLMAIAAEMSSDWKEEILQSDGVKVLITHKNLPSSVYSRCCKKNVSCKLHKLPSAAVRDNL